MQSHPSAPFRLKQRPVLLTETIKKVTRQMETIRSIDCLVQIYMANICFTLMHLILLHHLAVYAADQICESKGK